MGRSKKKGKEGQDGQEASPATLKRGESRGEKLFAARARMLDGNEGALNSGDGNESSRSTEGVVVDKGR
jgi:hypothetical protein